MPPAPAFPPPAPDLRPRGLLRAVLLMSWLQTPAGKDGAAKESLRREYATLAGVSAIVTAAFGTLTASSQHVAEASWERGMCAAMWMGAFALAFLATVNAVRFLLATNECTSDYQASRFVANMGVLMLLPAQLLNASFFAAFFALIFFAAANFNTFYSVVSILMVSVLFCTQTSLSCFMVHSLFAAKLDNEQHGQTAAAPNQHVTANPLASGV